MDMIDNKNEVIFYAIIPFMQIHGIRLTDNIYLLFEINCFSLTLRFVFVSRLVAKTQSFEYLYYKKYSS